MQISPPCHWTIPESYHVCGICMNELYDICDIFIICVNYGEFQVTHSIYSEFGIKSKNMAEFKLHELPLLDCMFQVVWTTLVNTWRRIWCHLIFHTCGIILHMPLKCENGSVVSYLNELHLNHIDEIKSCKPKRESEIVINA